MQCCATVWATCTCRKLAFSPEVATFEANVTKILFLTGPSIYWPTLEWHLTDNWPTQYSSALDQYLVTNISVNSPYETDDPGNLWSMGYQLLNSVQYAILSSKESKFVIVYNLLHCNYNVVHSKPFLTPVTNLEVQVPLFDQGPNIEVYCCCFL